MGKKGTATFYYPGGTTDGMQAVPHGGLPAVKRVARRRGCILVSYQGPRIRSPKLHFAVFHDRVVQVTRGWFEEKLAKIRGG